MDLKQIKMNEQAISAERLDMTRQEWSCVIDLSVDKSLSTGIWKNGKVIDFHVEKAGWGWSRNEVTISLDRKTSNNFD